MRVSHLSTLCPKQKCPTLQWTMAMPTPRSSRLATEPGSSSSPIARDSPATTCRKSEASGARFIRPWPRLTPAPPRAAATARCRPPLLDQVPGTEQIGSIPTAGACDPGPRPFAAETSRACLACFSATTATPDVATSARQSEPEGFSQSGSVEKVRPHDA